MHATCITFAAVVTVSTYSLLTPPTWATLTLVHWYTMRPPTHHTTFLENVWNMAPTWVVVIMQWQTIAWCTKGNEIAGICKKCHSICVTLEIHSVVILYTGQYIVLSRVQCGLSGWYICTCTHMLIYSECNVHVCKSCDESMYMWWCYDSWLCCCTASTLGWCFTCSVH